MIVDRRCNDRSRVGSFSGPSKSRAPLKWSVWGRTCGWVWLCMPPSSTPFPICMRFDTFSFWLIQSAFICIFACHFLCATSDFLSCQFVIVTYKINTWFSLFSGQTNPNPESRGKFENNDLLYPSGLWQRYFLWCAILSGFNYSILLKGS